MKKPYVFFVFIILFISTLSIGTLQQSFKKNTLDSSYESKNLLHLTNSGVKNLSKESMIPNPTLKFPFSGFIQNKGQLNQNEIKYYYSSNDVSVGFLTSKILFSVRDNSNRISNLELSFVGSQVTEPQAIGKSSSITNFFMNGLSIPNVPNYQKIMYSNLYPNIDLLYYFSNQGLKYEFIVKPGGNPANIIIQANKNIQVDASKTKISYFDHLSDNKPLLIDDKLFVYQGLQSTQIKAYYSLDVAKNKYKITIDPSTYDHKQNLIIDPIWVEFSTYFGGFGTEVGRSVATDTFGNVYVTGYTSSTESSFPLVNPYDGTFGGSNDVFVAKFNATGNGLIYSTYIGGSGDDEGYSIKVDVNGNSYISGFTSSSSFPTVNAFNGTYGGGTDAFVLKLNATGNGLDYSTFIGGAGYDEAQSIEIDNFGNSYITGYTLSNGSFPLKNPYNDVYSGSADIFALKLNSTGNGIDFSTYLGGTDDDRGYGITIDDQFNVYITGYTVSNESSFPLVNAYDETYGGGFADAFVIKLNTTGNGIFFSTYLGGNDIDEGYRIKVDSSYNVFVTGDTASSNFPVINGYDLSHNGAGSYDVFVTKLNATGTGLIYSTFIGGVNSEHAYGLAIDLDGNAYITGNTQSTETSFPILHASDGTANGGLIGDVFITKLNSTGTGLDYSTFLGGSDNEVAYGLALDSLNNTVVTGYTKSTDFQTVNAFDPTNNLGQDAFVARLSSTVDDSSPSITLYDPTNTTYYGKSITLNYTIFENNPSILKIYVDGVVNTTALPSGHIITFLTNGSHTISLTATDKAGNTATTQVWFTLNDALTLNILNKVDYSNSKNIFFSYSLINKTSYFSSVYIDTVLNTSVTNNSYIYLSEGFHNITLVGVDSNSNVFSDQWLITVDSVKPNIIINNPTNNEYYASTSLILDYQISDLNLLSTEIFLDSSSNSSSEQSGFTITGLTDGLHNLTILATDKANNQAILQVMFYIDTTDPVITVNNPNTSKYSNNSILLDYSVLETNLLNLTIFIDGIKNKSNLWSGSYLNLADGYHNITLEAFDKAGNFIIVTKVFTIDTISPVLTITSPSSTTYNTTNISFDYFITDVNGYSVVIFIDNQANQSTIVSKSSLQLQEGTHNITIVATDTYGNSVTKTVLFTIVLPSNTTTTTTSSSSTTTTTSSSLSSNKSTETGSTTTDFPILIMLISTIIVSVLRKKRKN